jgi:hypothetical protein
MMIIKGRKQKYRKRNFLKKEISLCNYLKSKSLNFNKKISQIFFNKKIKLTALTLNYRLKIIYKNFLKLDLRV